LICTAERILSDFSPESILTAIGDSFGSFSESSIVTFNAPSVGLEASDDESSHSFLLTPGRIDFICGALSLFKVNAPPTDFFGVTTSFRGDGLPSHCDRENEPLDDDEDGRVLRLWTTAGDSLAGLGLRTAAADLFGVLGSLRKPPE
jgi:hypothetical protein